MKFIVLVPDGMADEPLAELGNKTPLEKAQTPNMDFMAQHGFCAMAQTIPDGMPPGSDIGNLSLLGYDPRENFSGRAPLEAANMGVMLNEDEVAFRCNMVTIDNGIMKDYSAGHISTQDATQIINDLNQKINIEHVRFIPGKSYRHLMILKTSNAGEFLKIKTTPPHDILDKKIDEYLPQGSQEKFLLEIISHAQTILSNHRINQSRAQQGEHQANQIWLWGQGSRPQLPLFKDKFGLTGGIISAVDLVNGIGRLAGLEVIAVPGITGYYDTDYGAKARFGLESLKRNDFVYIHVESPDEAGHNGDIVEKIKAIENIDSQIVGPLLTWARSQSDVRILISPDHPTPVKKRTHTNAPVCFLMFGPGIECNGLAHFNEQTAAQAGLHFRSGAQMIAQFLKK